jgi:regulator of RNase E activity RraA
MTTIAPIDLGPLVPRFLALPDLSSTVSDALDELGVGGVVAGTHLAPLTEDSRACGPAVTMRSVADPRSGQAVDDRAVYAAAPQGGVIVMDLSGTEGAAGLGGLGATIATRAGVAGVCVVPAGRAAEVLERCEAIEAAEAALLERLAAERAGLPGG